MSIKRWVTVCILLVVSLMTGLILFLGLLAMSLPDTKALQEAHLQEPLRIFAHDGQLIEEFGEIRRIPVSLNQVPPLMVQAVLATEDQRFYTHPGVDILGLLRAVSVLVTTGEKQQGGSTITMQVARNFFLSRQKTFLRKIEEILLAIKIDQSFSKEKILELYFNKIFYGNRAYGIAAAAKTYYDKSLDQLTLPEIATLAGIPKSPSTMNPLINPTAAKARRDHVLDRMLELHIIDSTAYSEAIATPIQAQYHGEKVSIPAPYIAEMIRQMLVQQVGDQAYTEGYRVYTTVDAQKQLIANWALRKNLIRYDQRHGYRGPEKNWGHPQLDHLQVWVDQLKEIPTIQNLFPAIVLTVSDLSAEALLKNGDVITIPWEGMKWARKRFIQDKQEFWESSPTTAQEILKVGDQIRVEFIKNRGWVLTQVPEVEGALVVLDHQDGAILALVGGFNYNQSNFNRAVQAQRQAGSSFKPFVFSAALEKGYTLATTLSDAPVVTLNSGGTDPLWRPENSTKQFYGPTRLRVALTNSRNLVSIRLLQSVGLPYTLDYMTRFGFKTEQLPSELSLALGTASVSPLQLARGYTVFANTGYLVKPYLVEQITNSSGAIVYKASPEKMPLDNKGSVSVPENTSTAKSPEATRVITAQNAYLITSALQDVIRQGTGQTARSLKRNDIAGKTGTTNEQKDAWFSGYTPHWVVTAWVGFDDFRSVYEYGAEAALPMWIDFLKVALHDQPEEEWKAPPNIVTVRINRQTGLLTTSNDPDALFELFEASTVPTEKSSSNTDPLNSSSGVPEAGVPEDKIPSGMGQIY